ncbi:hypothetical protein [Desertivirga xinjiangensis]|uniref:hypothetical protein n=1 Tax=Desertivirga xinjiangensis TaxID=539206 RepID=UPI00210A49CA|nr:hypothetical protein [Pedobacter xinjiangensis]
MRYFLISVGGSATSDGQWQLNSFLHQNPAFPQKKWIIEECQKNFDYESAVVISVCEFSEQDFNTYRS